MSTSFMPRMGARAWLQLQIAASIVCALTPVLEINALLGQAAADPSYPGPAPHEWAGMMYSLVANNHIC